MKIRIAVNNERFSSKPLDIDAGRITNSMSNTEFTIKQLVDHISKGCTWCPATFKNNSKNSSSFQQLQCFGIDIDGSLLTPQDFYEQLPKYIKPWFAYYTLSHGIKTPRHNRFRLVFVFDLAVPDKEGATKFINTLLQLCKDIDPGKNDDGQPIVDSHCKSISQMLYGGKLKPVVWGDNIVCLDELADYQALGKDLQMPYRVEQYEPLQQLVRMYTLRACTDILNRASEKRCGRNSAINTVAGFLTSFRTDRELREHLQTVIDDGDFEPQHDAQFNRIYNNTSDDEFNSDYWLEPEKFRDLVLSTIENEPLEPELCHTVLNLIKDQNIPTNIRGYLQRRLKNAIRFYRTKNRV